MSLILKFRDDEARRTFFERTRRERTDIFHRLKPLRVFPDAIAQRTSREQDEWLRQAIGEDGKVYEDVTFKPVAT